MKRILWIRRLVLMTLALLLLPGVPASAGAVPETEPLEEAPERMFSSEPYQLYFGLLHAHTDLSDGLGTVEEAFSFAREAGLDFFAVTDHSNSLDESQWDRGRTAARDATTADFLGLCGYEMTWQEDKRMGHIAAFGTEGFRSRNEEAFSNPTTGLENYYQVLARETGSVAMFCHPGIYYGDFHGFGHYHWEYDRHISLLEVVSGQEAPAWNQYHRALDAGWHLAPSANQNNHNGLWGSESDVRTVILAETLTEEALLSAIRQCRVYATEDRDLHLYYDLDGQVMGSIVSRAEQPEISLLAWDPTDEAIGTVEVVTEGGTVLASETTAEQDAWLTFCVSGGFRYYYLRITQPDGDMAVTAPVWVEGFENMGILDFSADSTRPVQDQPLGLTLELYNEEPVDFCLHTLELYADDDPVMTVENPGTVAAGETLTLPLTYTHPLTGETVLEVRVRGTVQGEPRCYKQTLPLRFRSGVAVTGILVDGSHENQGLDHLTRLCAIAEEQKQELTLVTEDLPQGGELLLIPSPGRDFDPYFLQDVRAFAQSGGDLILWGQRERLEPLLEALDLSMGLRTEPVAAGAGEWFARESPWCADVEAGQYFSFPDSHSVEPGQGQWLVRRSADGPVLLACEKTAWGGTVFLSGSPFLLDRELPEVRTRWELPGANETIFRTILGHHQTLLTRSAVGMVRKASPGESCRVRGYVTAGNSNIHNRFPDTLYLQDETGGIAITGCAAEDIQVGTPMEVIGKLGAEDGNLRLECEDYRLPEEPFYRWVPATIGCGSARDYAANGGRLVQVEGRVVSRELTEDRKGITRLVLRDFRGEEAIVEIGPTIFSGATGENTLAKEIRRGRTARAMGLVHINEAGETVIRVRNCEEVVDVPPTTDQTNPPTGDRTVPGWVPVCIAFGIICIRKRSGRVFR